MDIANRELRDLETALVERTGRAADDVVVTITARIYRRDSHRWDRVTPCLRLFGVHPERHVSRFVDVVDVVDVA
jgi:hypothetical protein